MWTAFWLIQNIISDGLINWLIEWLVCNFVHVKSTDFRHYLDLHLNPIDENWIQARDPPFFWELKKLFHYKLGQVRHLQN